MAKKKSESQKQVNQRMETDRERIRQAKTLDDFIYVLAVTWLYWYHHEREYPRQAENLLSGGVRFRIIDFRRNSSADLPPSPTDWAGVYEWINMVTYGKKPMRWTGRQIVKHFEVSMPTLRRYVHDKKLTDYREMPHADNAMLLLDPVEVARYFGRKS